MVVAPIRMLTLMLVCALMADSFLFAAITAPRVWLPIISLFITITAFYVAADIARNCL